MEVKNDKVCVGVLFYNEFEALQRLIPNLLEHGVPESNIIAFDGPFDLFPHKGKATSTDGSREYLKYMDIKIIDCGICTHIEKTNKRFKQSAKEGFGLMLAIDSDEYILGDWKEFLKHLRLVMERMGHLNYSIPFLDLDGFYKDRAVHQRLFLDPGNMEYRGRHWWVFHKSSQIQQASKWVISNITIIHDSSIRPKNRTKQMETFQKSFNKFEKTVNETTLDNYTILKKKCGCQIAYLKQLHNDIYRVTDISHRCKQHATP